MLRRAGIFSIAAIAAISTLLCAPAQEAHAQLLCPPGTFIARSRGKLICARNGTPTKKPAGQQSREITSSRVTPDSETKISRKVVDSTISCAEFNAKFTTFHQSYANHFGEKSRRQDQSAAQLRTLIAQKKQLRDELRAQSFRARDLRVRRHLRVQAHEISSSIAAEEKQLREIEEGNDQRSEKWKADYKGKASAILSTRPRGCQVAAAR